MPFLLLALGVAGVAQAELSQRVVDIPTRPGVTQRFVLLAPAKPKAAIILFAGGHGGLQIRDDGSYGWGKGNFLVRSREHFAERDLVVAVLDAQGRREPRRPVRGLRVPRLQRPRAPGGRSDRRLDPRRPLTQGAARWTPTPGGSSSVGGGGASQAGPPALDCRPMPTPTATERLAHFIHDIDPAKLPSAVREQATLCVLDALGIALAGMSEPSARAARAVARNAGGREESRVLVSGERLPAQAAALVNGTAAFSHNFTDTTLTCILHAGPAVVPAALAAGELAGATGAEVLAAVVAGYEVMSRVGSAINAGPARMAHQKKGFHPTATCGVFGATAAAARLWRLPVETTVHALGVAGSLASGLSISLRDGSDVWRAHAGFAAGQGLLAARLAQEGLTGPRAVLDDPRGFCAAFTDGHYDLEALTSGLGSRLLILDAAFKLHNVAHVWALPLDALAILRQEHGFTGRDVERVDVTFPQTWVAINDAAGKTTWDAPHTYSQATNDLRYCVGVGLLDGRVHVEQFDERHLRDPAVLDLARRVIPHPEPALNPIWETTDKAPVDVELHLKSGARHRLHVDYPRGAPQNPATRAELEAKFDAVAAPALAGPRRARVRSAVRDLERLTSLTDLMDALIAEGSASRGPASARG